MESLRHWALLLCAAAVLGGTVQMLLPEKEQSTGIKLVLGLYIVVTALSPAANIDWDRFTAQVQAPVQTAPEASYSGWVVQYSQDTLERQLQARLDQQAPGYTVQQVTLDYDPETGNCEALGAVLEGAGQEADARRVVQEMLGTQAEVEYREGGESDAAEQME